jgi:glutaredoxin
MTVFVSNRINYTGTPVGTVYTAYFENPTAEFTRRNFHAFNSERGHRLTKNFYCFFFFLFIILLLRLYIYMRIYTSVCVLILSDVLLKDAQNFNRSKQTVFEKRSCVNCSFVVDCCSVHKNIAFSFNYVRVERHALYCMQNKINNNNNNNNSIVIYARNVIIGERA